MLLNTNMRILNGRKIGDLSGSFTCYEWNGQSLIGYFITSDHFFPLVKYLKVEDKTEFSDHCRITCALKLFTERRPLSNTVKNTLPVKYFWDNNYDEVKKIIQLEANKESSSSFLNTSFDPDNSGDVENATNSVTSIPNKVMHMGLRIKRKHKKTKHNPNHKTFFDNECLEAKRLMRKYATLLTKNPLNRQYNSLYFSYLKNFKQLCRNKTRNYENNLIKQLETLANQNPKKSWQIVDTLREKTKKKASSNISADDWNTHFKDLLNCKCEPPEHYLDRVNSKLEKLCKLKSFTELDYFITSEILKCIKAPGKTSGLDSILNEVIKAIAYEILPTLQKLFNQIYNSDYYPLNWRKPLTIPIFKKRWAFQ